MKKTFIIASAFIAIVSQVKADVKHHARKAEAAQKELPAHPDKYDDLITKQAKRHGVPESLVHRIVQRESRYRANAMNRIYFGLMQITYPTARSMGYKGAPKGLLDAETNLTYAVPYLANAYMVAGKNEDRAVSLYAAGYYFEAQRQHKLDLLRTASSEPVAPEPVVVAEQMQEPPANPVSFLFHALIGTPDLTPGGSANPAPATAETSKVAVASAPEAKAAAQAPSTRAPQAPAPAEAATATTGATASADTQQSAQNSAEATPAPAPEKLKVSAKKSAAKTSKGKTSTETTVADKTSGAKTTLAKADTANKKLAAKKTVLAAVKPANNGDSAPASASNNGNSNSAEANLRH